MKKTKLIKKILGSLLILVSIMAVFFMLFDYFYIPFKLNKVAAIFVCLIALIVYFIVDHEN